LHRRRAAATNPLGGTRVTQATDDRSGHLAAERSTGTMNERQDRGR
jgi:hypothetical protein